MKVGDVIEVITYKLDGISLREKRIPAIVQEVFRESFVARATGRHGLDEHGSALKMFHLADKDRTWR
jgi:hypothetical protein